MIRKSLWVLLSLGLSLSTLAGAGSFRIEGPFTERKVNSLEQAMRESAQGSGIHWIGWTVDAMPSKVHGGQCALFLGQGQNHWNDGDRTKTTSAEILVLVELRDGEVQSVEIATTGCRIDAREVDLEIWQGVTTRASYKLLDELLLDHADPDLREEGIAAIARHRLDVVDGRLERVALEDRHEEVRHGAIFWLGASRGPAGYETLRRLEDHLSPLDIEEALVFGYYVSEEPEATQRLIHLARRHERPVVRSQALFWVAQEAGEAAIATLEKALENDPQREVREQAVFGLSQLPEEQAVPALIKVARTHKDPEVRELAFFWLGQMEDPRVFELFEEVLGVR